MDQPVDAKDGHHAAGKEPLRLSFDLSKLGAFVADGRQPEEQENTPCEQ